VIFGGMCDDIEFRLQVSRGWTVRCAPARAGRAVLSGNWGASASKHLARIMRGSATGERSCVARWHDQCCRGTIADCSRLAGLDLLDASPTAPA